MTVEHDRAEGRRRGLVVRYLMSIALLGCCAGLPFAATAEEPKTHRAPAASAGIDELASAWPEEVGIDSRELIRLSEWIRKEDLDVHSLLIVKDGKLVFERYSSGLTRTTITSCTRSPKA